MNDRNSSKINKFKEGRDWAVTLEDERPKPKIPLFSDDFRSQEVQDIISERPGFWGRWALPVFLFILLCIVAGTWFIRYPDTIKATATLEAINGSRPIVTRQEGTLTKLFVKNGDVVHKGDFIGWMESSGSHRQIIRLGKQLDSALFLLKKQLAGEIMPLFIENFNNLGELQPDYQQFVLALEQFNDYLKTGYYYQEKRTLLDDLSFLKTNRKAILHQLELSRKDLILAEKDFNANQQLYDEKVISALDYRSSKSKYLNKKQSIPQMEQALTANLHQQADKRADIAELEHTISKQKGIFTQTFHTLKSKVDQWIMRYVIKAPVSGSISFVLPLQENSFLVMNKILGYVNPPDSKYYARINFSQINFGKAQMGQPVQLRLTAYPYEQFGILKGRLTYISSVASDSGFLGRVSLPNGLVTEYHHSIQFRTGLQAQALIISHPMRLLQRFYYNMVKKAGQ